MLHTIIHSFIQQSFFINAVTLRTLIHAKILYALYELIRALIFYMLTHVLKLEVVIHSLIFHTLIHTLL
jgi:hypothetical protein